MSASMKVNRTTYRQFFQLLIILCFSGFLLMFTSCANPGRPTGGQKDKTAPGVDSTNSTPSPSTNFKDDRVKITFDEWVKLDNVNSQLVISPPLNENPEVKLKGKTVELIFQDSLRENTTYSIYLGSSVKDITEGNAAKNVNITFSTGPYLDSLETRGNVIDAFTGKKKEDMLVMLYPATANDSIVFKEKPIYLAKTESNGSFKIKHIKEGDYKVFALEDKNFNYLYDDTETIGFLKEPLTINDSTSANIKLLVFVEDQKTTIKGIANNQYGKTRIAFNKPPEDINVEVLKAPAELNYYTEFVKDSIVFWYENSEEDISLLIKEKSTIIDTVEVKPASMSTFLENNKSKLDFDRATSRTTGSPTGTKAGLGKKGASNPTIPESKLFEKARLKVLKKKLVANKTEYLYFTFPLEALDLSKVIVLQDSSGQTVKPEIRLSDSLKRAIEIKHNWKPDVSYSMVFMPGAISSFYGFKNDSLVLELIGVSTADYGSITLLVDGLFADKSYFLSTLNAREQVIFETVISGVESYKKRLEKIEPASGYKVKIVEDSNRNGKWDPGSYFEKRAPERILIQPLQTVKPNWEVEGKINFSDKKSEKPQSLKKG